MSNVRKQLCLFPIGTWYCKVVSSKLFVPRNELLKKTYHTVDMSSQSLVSLVVRTWKDDHGRFFSLKEGFLSDCLFYFRLYGVRLHQEASTVQVLSLRQGGAPVPGSDCLGKGDLGKVSGSNLGSLRFFHLSSLDCFHHYPTTSVEVSGKVRSKKESKTEIYPFGKALSDTVFYTVNILYAYTYRTLSLEGGQRA